jgi:Ca2+-binding RTX toxin-like protein
VVASGVDNDLTGGAGDDVIDGGGGNDTLHASGDDVLRGGPGDDHFDEGAPESQFIHGYNGSSVIEGGSGDDTVDYGTRTAAVVVDTDGVADDGDPVVKKLGIDQVVEQDNVKPDVERVIGGVGADVLRALRIDGNAGDACCSMSS